MSSRLVHAPRRNVAIAQLGPGRAARRRGRAPTSRGCTDPWALAEQLGDALPERADVLADPQGLRATLEDAHDGVDLALVVDAAGVSDPPTHWCLLRPGS